MKHDTRLILFLGSYALLFLIVAKKRLRGLGMAYYDHCSIHCGTFNAPCKIAEAAEETKFKVEYGACIGAREAKIVACRTGQAATQAGCEALKTAFNAAVAGEVGDVTATVSGTL